MLTDLDLLADGADALPEAGPFGLGVTGVRRVAELVGYELGLAVDSVAGRPSGTGLLAATAGANTGFDLVAAFSAAAQIVLDRLAGWETPDTPDDEKLTAILLTDIQTVETVVTLVVDVKTVGGSGTVTVTLDAEE